jgi:hypothetical protein
MHELTDAIGLLEKAGCGCRALARKMDTWGPDGCEVHRQEIVEHLNKAAAGVSWPQRLRATKGLLSRRIFLNPLDPAGSLLDAALALAKRKPLEILFNLPPGIGDCSWVYSKIAALAETRGIAVRVGASGLARSLSFVQLLPHVDCLGWGPQFSESSKFVDFHTDLASLEPGEYSLFANPWLEDGHRLLDAWPKQETRYHYRIDTTPAMVARAKQIVGNAQRPVIGFYCSSGRRDDRWQNIWSTGDWLQLLQGAAKLVPGATFVAVSALYDTRTASVARILRDRGYHVRECIGPHIGVTIEVMRRLEYFFAYPSGLGILGDVIDTPTLMFYWPGFHDRFIDTYADPKNVENGRHLNLLFPPVPEALAVFKERGLPCID